MKMLKMWSLFALAVSLYSCNDKVDENYVPIQVGEFSFEKDTEGWTGGLAEYSKTLDSATIEFAFKRSALPKAIDTTKNGLMIQSHNRSDDMFMFLKRKVSGLEPNRVYGVTFEIDLGTSYPANSVGTGGSPGSSVYLKAGASPKEPMSVLENDFYKFNLDKGQQAEGGKELVLLGNVANGLETEAYKIVKRDNLSKSVEVLTDAKGVMWLCIGTDSGFEGLTRLYYDKIRVTLTPREMVIN